MRKSRLLLNSSALTILALASASPVRAQSVAIDPSRFVNADENGVDLVDGSFNFSVNEGSIGNGEGALALIRSYGLAGWRDGYDSRLSRSTVNNQVVVKIAQGTTTATFTKSGGVFVPANADGSTLTEINGGDAYLWTLADGTMLSYPARSLTPGPSAVSSTICTASITTSCFLPISTITKPNGLITAISYTIAEYCQRNSVNVSCSDDSLPFTNVTRGVRIGRVSNNAGYAIDFTYVTNTFQPGANVVNWYRRSTAVFRNTGATSSTWPTISYAYPTSTTTQTTDIGGRVWAFTYSGTSDTGLLTAVRRPGAATNNITISYISGQVVSITANGVSTSYTRSASGSIVTTTVTDANSNIGTAIGDTALGRVTSITDELSRTTAYSYDASARLTQVTRPEGDKTIIAYDTRGNTTSTTARAKPGSGLADIVLTSSYPANCANPVTCNKPTWTRDAKGNQTDFTYDATHGGLLTATAPAAISGGIRPQTRFGYAAVGPVTMLTSIASCQTLASCAGTADETKTTTAYTTNLLPNSITAASGNGSVSATTSYTYDILGNQITVDGPLAGTADTTRNRYNSARLVVGVVGPDPDAGGSRLPLAQRFTYNNDGQVTLSEVGTVADQSDAAWASFSSVQQASTSYDANARPIKSELKVGATTYASIQASYDALGRIDCVAQRMDPAQWGSQTNACTAQTTGPNGADRVTKRIYNAASQLVQVQVGVGTVDAAIDQTYTYSANSRPVSVSDGENNLTTYVYDGFDRLSQTRYPVPTQGSGSSSTTDFEQLSYDVNGNVTQRRLRDGKLVSYAFDNLDRVTTKTPPSPELAVSYGYDLLGRLRTAARPGDGVTQTFDYDALNRLTSEAQPFGGTMSWQYDAAGRRTRATWGDGFFVTYDYDVTNRMLAIRENGAASGVGVLASYAYDNLGRRASTTRGNGTTTAYAYDPVSRLSSVGQNLLGTANDITIGSMAYNPASQIVSQQRSNDSYAWNGHYNVNRNYTVNGLNQLTSAGAVTLGYDGRGNLTTSGTTGYAYTSDNLLKSTSTGISAGYDTSGRLIEYNSSVSTRFNYDGGQISAEIANPSGAVQRRYIWGPGPDEIVTWYEGAGANDRRFAHQDERGSVIAWSDGTGALIAINRYDEYGIPASTNIGRFQYTGQAWLDGLGMYHYKARLYSPTLGRFMQTDPIGYGDGINWYNYVGSDPVNGTDSSGLADDDDEKICQESCGTTFKGGPRNGEGQGRLVDNVTPQSDGRGGFGYYSSTDGGKTASWVSVSAAAANFSISSGRTRSGVSIGGAVPQNGDLNGDGRLSLDEANQHYADGTGTPIVVNASKLTVRLEGPIPAIGGNVIGSVYGTSDWLVFGRVSLTRTGAGTYSIGTERYDFDIKPWDSVRNVFRNLETYGGSAFAGSGVGFETRFYGSPRVIPQGCTLGRGGMSC